MSTLEGVKRYINKMGNAPSSAAPKRIVMLDWVSNEDGSHILTVTVGNKVTQLYYIVFYKDFVLIIFKHLISHEAINEILKFVYPRYYFSRPFRMIYRRQTLRQLMMQEVILEIGRCFVNLLQWHFNIFLMKSGKNFDI